MAIKYFFYYSSHLIAYMLNQSVRYFQLKHAFQCEILSDSLYASNMFCENFNHCEMKAKCVQNVGNKH